MTDFYHGLRGLHGSEAFIRAIRVIRGLDFEQFGDLETRELLRQTNRWRHQIGNENDAQQIAAANGTR